MTSDGTTLRAILDRHRQRILALPGVHGVALGRSSAAPHEPRILVFTQSGEWPDGLEPELDGHRIEVARRGPFRAL